MLWLINQLGAGGAERLLISAARVHDRSRFEFEAAYVLEWNNTLVAELESTGVAVHCLGASTAWDFRWAVRLKRLLQDGAFDIVHVHSPFVAALARMLTFTMPTRRRPMVVVTTHASWHCYRLATRVAGALTLGLQDAHIAVSEDARSSLPARLRGRAQVITQGVLVDELATLRSCRAGVRAELGIGDEELLVLTVANFVREKNYPALLSAARTVLDSGVKARFLAAGHGPLEDEIRALHRQLSLGRAFTFLGFRKDAVRLMAGADLFVMASVYEGYPVAVMEALCVGAPVVATSVGGIPDAVRDGTEGRVVPPERPDLLAKAIIDLAHDPALRDSMSSAALARSRRFDIAITVGKVEAVYSDVLANSRQVNPAKFTDGSPPPSPSTSDTT